MSDPLAGPWTVTDKLLILDPAGECVCVVGDPYGAPTPADERRAPMLAATPDLLGGFKRLVLAYVSLLEIGRDRIVSAGGQCDPVDVMEAGDPALRAARAVIAKAEGSANG